MEKLNSFDSIPLKKFKSGKVREVFESDGNLLIVSTDRISAFDYVLPSLIPDKGRVLNSIASFWFEKTAALIPNHILHPRPHEMPAFKDFAETIWDRAVLVKKLKPFPIEAIVRAYLVGSGWKSYQKSGDICGVKCPQGLEFAAKLPDPIFTPSTKAESGHDENISFSEMCRIIGKDDAEKIRDLSLKLFKTGSRMAAEKGIIIADSKFEFGMGDNGEIVLIDEIFTPDSSRFWKQKDYIISHKKGEEPPAFDKQFVRNFLLNSNWDRKSVPPELPDDVIKNTRSKYLEIYRIITGKNL